MELRPQALPTARTALGSPIASAMRPLENQLGVARRACIVALEFGVAPVLGEFFERLRSRIMKGQMANPPLRPAYRTAPEWTFSQAPMNPQTRTFGFKLSRRGRFQRHAQIVQAPRTRQPRLQRRIQHTRRFAQPPLGELRRQALQKILRRNPRPAVKQPMKMRRTQPRDPRQLFQPRLKLMPFVQMPDHPCHAFKVIHTAILNEISHLPTRFLLRWVRRA
jgi:hypothetical protein